MRLLFTGLMCMMLFLSLGCKHHSSHRFTMSVIAIENEADLIGKWSFSAHWSGHMGVALEIKQDGTFEYWSFSDFSIGRKPGFPIRGKWELTKGTLRLDPDTEDHLYALDWVYIEYEEHKGLFSADNLNVLVWHETTPDMRMMYKNDEAGKWPMLNMANPDDAYNGLFGD